MSKTICDNCEEEIDNRGLASHQKGGTCKAEGRSLRMLRAEYYRVAHNTAEALARRPLLNYIFDPQIRATNFIRGCSTKKGFFTRQGWIQNPQYLSALKAKYGSNYDKMERELHNIFFDGLDSLKNLITLGMQGV